ncbi:MAG: 7-keto-8-aminopelargonate synthetase-related enzyme [Phormidesmis priestleyi Ana]|uniref:7-keto-8-aminopelargonate synthetase-related enzyme n=1 Tax=Phormidesmis priestleyi Ana TaxID=1666911 RepID=A0A0P7ZTI2_9CYAN|nr:MAG: 7-keto-8-aminopelargonate synthetase-related enzyme [Phormidesmis priestleyi Ana]
MDIQSKLTRLKQQLNSTTQSNGYNTATINPSTINSLVSTPSLTPSSTPAVVPQQYYDPALFPEYKEFTTMEWFYEKQNYTQNLFRKHAGASGATVSIDGRELINYSSYNYLGLANDPRVKKAAQTAVEEFGTSTGSGRSITGEVAPHQEFEREISEILGTEDAVLSVGGYSTNTFSIGYLCRAQDLIIYDELIHNSALTGCKLAGSRRFSFPHNDYDALENLLATHRSNFERVLILTEGVYSMDGDIPDIPRLIEIKQKYQALLMVDEAHSMGVIGPNGLGVTDYFKVSGKEIDILYGSMSKAFGTCGGYVAGPKPLVTILKHYAPGVLLYGASPTPANTAAGLETLRIMRSHPKLAQRVQANAAYFIEKAQAAGLNTYNSKGSGVVPIMTQDSELALWLSVTLFDQGICTYPMLYPIVPRDKSRLRFFINTNHTREQIDYTIDCIVNNLRVAPPSQGVM